MKKGNKNLGGLDFSAELVLRRLGPAAAASSLAQSLTALAALLAGRGGEVAATMVAFYVV